MGNVLRADVESKLSRLPEVKEVNVQVVFVVFCNTNMRR